MVGLSLPSFENAFGRHSARLRGIGSWEEMRVLGRVNLERLVQLAQERVYVLLGEGAERSELQAVRQGIDFLNELLAAQPPVKPLLPRLRAENFRKGDVVWVYLGDTPGSVVPQPWVAATITDVAKWYRAEWADGRDNTGYYWRLTATAPVPLSPDQDYVVFSTSEPRVLPAADFTYLTNAITHDAPFFDCFCANAWRTWEPLWCQERDVHSAGGGMDMKTWLQTAR